MVNGKAMRAWTALESSWDAVGYLKNVMGDESHLRVVYDLENTLCDLQCALEHEFLDDLIAWYRYNAEEGKLNISEGEYPYHYEIAYMIHHYFLFN